MSKYLIALITTVCISSFSLAKSVSDSVYSKIAIKLQTVTGDIHGILTLPNTNKKVPVALIIAGSGPTDRNDNNPTMKMKACGC